LMVAAMWSLQPRPLVIRGDASPFSQDDLLNALGESNSTRSIALSLFRSADVSPEEKSLAANRVLLLDDGGGLPDSALDALTSVARDALRGSTGEWAVLASHAVDRAAADCLVDGRPESFLRHRQRNLVGILGQFLAANTEWSFEDTPALDSLDLDDDDVRDDEFPASLRVE